MQGSWSGQLENSVKYAGTIGSCIGTDQVTAAAIIFNPNPLQVSYQ